MKWISQWSSEPLLGVRVPPGVPDFMLKVIIFDVDGVLVDTKEANIDLYQTLLRMSGYPVPSREAVLKCFHLSLWHSIEKLIGTKDPEKIKPIWDLGHDPSVRNYQLFEFPEKVESILEKLHKKYKLAIVTSRIRIGIDDVFRAKDIKHLFDVVVTFEDYKNPKPHPEPLLVALEKLGVNADEAIYIGDSDSDIVAAKAAGMRSIHLAITNHEDATAGVRELKELENAIAKLENT